MEYLEKEDVFFINKKTIDRHGGIFVPPSNYLNESALDYVLEAVKSEMYSQPLYPIITDKAGLYMFNIISNHVFQDGNKRTGLESALLFLKLNGFQLKENLESISSKTIVRIPKSGESSTEILIEFTLELAAGKISLENCQNWFSKNIEKTSNH